MLVGGNSSWRGALFYLKKMAQIIMQIYILERDVGKRSRRKNAALQIKISAMIIFTDFLCWIVDTPNRYLFSALWRGYQCTSDWYPVFSIALLPLNSVINPETISIAL